MSFINKIFGKKPPATSVTTVNSSVTNVISPAAKNTVPSDPSKDPNMIRVFDAYGREMFITKQQWRDSVLVGHIKKVWSDPENLASTIIQALKDGFVADMLEPAEHLAEIDPNHERGAIVLAIIYRELKRLDDSEKVLRRHIERHGESGTILTNLAKIHSDRGNNELSHQTLWHGLELDPNQENGLMWYQAISREKEGEAGALRAFKRVSALSGAWRARLWLARAALVRGQLNETIQLYEEAISFAPRPIPVDMLQQISGDLGNHGHLPEILRLAEPNFDPTFHGIQVGNNLIKAHLDLGQLDAARALVDRLYSYKRPDWQQTLSFWDTEIAKARTEVTNVGLPAVPKVTNVVIDGPIWLRTSSPAGPLCPHKGNNAVIVACMGSTFTGANTSTGDVRMQLSDTAGRISRSLPLYLAEQLHLRTDAIGRVLQPWIKEGHGGFVLCGVALKSEEAVSQARMGEQPADYVAILHFDGSSTPWVATLRLVRTIDGAELGQARAILVPENLEPAFEVLATDLLRLVSTHAQVHHAATPDCYRVPGGADFSYYQLRLEQALAAAMAATDGLVSGFLNGERDVILGNFQLCLNQPHNPTPRLLLAQTLLYLKKVRPEVVKEFQDKVALLQKEKPLSEPAHGIVQQMFNDVLAV